MELENARQIRDRFSELYEQFKANFEKSSFKVDFNNPDFQELEALESEFSIVCLTLAQDFHDDVTSEDFTDDPILLKIKFNDRILALEEMFEDIEIRRENIRKNG